MVFWRGNHASSLGPFWRKTNKTQALWLLSFSGTKAILPLNAVWLSLPPEASITEQPLDFLWLCFETSSCSLSWLQEEALYVAFLLFFFVVVFFLHHSWHWERWMHLDHFIYSHRKTCSCLTEQIGFTSGLSCFWFTGNLIMWHNKQPTCLTLKLVCSWIPGAWGLILRVLLLFTCPRLHRWVLCYILCWVENWTFTQRNCTHRETRRSGVGVLY